MISRDLWRISTRLDFFRLMHFYHSGAGYYLTNAVTMMTVYSSLYALLFFALAQASHVITAVIDPLNPDLIKAYRLDVSGTVLRHLTHAPSFVAVHCLCCTGHPTRQDVGTAVC